MNRCELLVRNYGGSTRFPVLAVNLMYVLPDGNRVCLLSNVGCTRRPDIVEQYIIEPLGEKYQEWLLKELKLVRLALKEAAFVSEKQGQKKS